MLTVAQWRTARHMQNGAANDLLEKDQEKMQLNFGVGDSLRGCLGGSAGCCCETSHAASLTFCPSSRKIFSVGNFWHFPVCLLNSGPWRTSMKNQTQMLSPLQGLWVLVSPLKNLFFTVLPLFVITQRYKQHPSTWCGTKAPLLQTLHFQRITDSLHF